MNVEGKQQELDSQAESDFPRNWMKVLQFVKHAKEELGLTDQETVVKFASLFSGWFAPR